MTFTDSTAPVADQTVSGAESTQGVQSAQNPTASEGYAEVCQAEGFVSMVLPPGAVITGGIAARAAEEFEQLASTGDKPLLLELTGIEAITRGARTVFGSSHSVSAIAVLGSTQVDRVIANFLLGGDLPSCPTKYFSSKADALAWLEGRAR